MDGPRGHCTKCNKSGRERQIPYDLTYVWNLKSKQNQVLRYKERIGLQRQERGGERDEWRQQLRNSSYEISKSWRCKVYSVVTIVNNTLWHI